MRFEAELDGRALAIEVTEEGGHGPAARAGGRYRVRVGDEAMDVDARRTGGGLWSLLVDGVSSVAEVVEADGTWLVTVGGEQYRIAVEEETRYLLRTHGGTAHASGQVVKAPMPGRVVLVEVVPGQVVKPGDGLVVLEAMKMENEFKASAAGTVREVRVQPGQAVNPGDVMIVIA